MWRRLAILVLLTGCEDPPAAMPDLAVAPDMQRVPCDEGTGECVMEVSGRLVDENGAPVPMVLLSVCAEACFFGRSEADGRFVTPIRERLPVERYALLVHGRPDRVSYYAKLPPVVDQKVVFQQPLVLPLLPTSGPELKTDKSQQTVTAGDVTLELAAGTEVQLDVEDVVDLPRGAQMKAVKLANPSSWPFVDAASVPDVLYALTPWEVKFVPKAVVRFANASGWPLGTAVDVLAQRSLIVHGAPPAGTFERVAGAHVTTNGIELDAGEGMIGFTIIGLKRK